MDEIQWLESKEDSESGAKIITQEANKRPLSNLNRSLNELELKSSGVQKLLLSQLDDFEACKQRLKDVETQFHDRDKKCAVYEERFSNNNSKEIFYSSLLVIGPALIGLSVSLPDSCKWTICILGGVVLLSSVCVKIFMK